VETPRTSFAQNNQHRTIKIEDDLVVTVDCSPEGADQTRVVTVSRSTLGAFPMWPDRVVSGDPEIAVQDEERAVKEHFGRDR